MNPADEESLISALKKTMLKFGRVDVVVNNAGYTHLATIEEMSDKAVRELFGINVFGMLNVVRNVLPTMRKQQSGHIFNVRACLIIHCTRLTAPLHDLFQPNFINVEPLHLKNLAEISRKVGHSAAYMNYQTRSSSLGAYNVGPLSGPYCATKHAVKVLSETLAMEVKQFGIHVTDVKSGFMRTEFFGASHKTDIYIKVAEMDNPP